LIRESLILLEDNHLLVYNKQPGDIVQGDKTGDEPLSDQLKSYIKVKYAKPGNVFLGVVHRIDRPVSGTVVFARTSKALARLNAMLKDGTMTKTYWAVVQNCPASLSGHLVHHVTRNEKQNKTYVHEEAVSASKRAELFYEVAGQSDRYFLLEVRLVTGRHHQIRAQLAHIGCPIRGDLKYGYPRSNADGSIHLHARRIGFIHPVKDVPVSVTARPPDEKVWNLFSEIGEREG